MGDYNSLYIIKWWEWVIKVVVCALNLSLYIFIQWKWMRIKTKKEIRCIIDDEKNHSVCISLTLFLYPSLRYFHCNELIMHEWEASDDEGEDEDEVESQNSQSIMQKANKLRKGIFPLTRHKSS